MREFINRYGVIVISASLVVAALFYFIFGRSGGGGRTFGNPAKAFYINDVTGDESVHSSSDVPPLLDKDGKPNLVLEVKVSCDNGRSPRVAYLRKYTPEVQTKIKELLARQEQSPDDQSMNDEIQRLKADGELIRLPASGSPWVAGTSEAGDKVREVLTTLCKPGQTPVPVSPR